MEKTTDGGKQVLYTREEAAKILRISPRTLANMIAAKQIRLVRIFRRTLISAREIDRFILDHEQTD